MLYTGQLNLLEREFYILVQIIQKNRVKTKDSRFAEPTGKIIAVRTKVAVETGKYIQRVPFFCYEENIKDLYPYKDFEILSDNIAIEKFENMKSWFNSFLGRQNSFLLTRFSIEGVPYQLIDEF